MDVLWRGQYIEVIIQNIRNRHSGYTFVLKRGGRPVRKLHASRVRWGYKSVCCFGGNRVDVVVGKIGMAP